jgi:ornithine cyclodeaminase/alanine dehydrogenase-like protein (mu-crystallin family)
MDKTVLRLDADDVWRTLETLDPVAVLAEELIKRAINHPDRECEPACRLVPWTGHDDQYILVGGLPRDTRCAMPAAALRMVHAAALAALATRELLPPGGITVAMLGTRSAMETQLAVLVKHVPDIVHVAVRITDMAETDTLAPRLLDQLDLAGIGLSVTTALAETLFGANLVVVVSKEALTEGSEHAGIKHLVRGTVLVNASGHDLPADLVDHVDQIYADDLALLPAHPGRYVVDRHLAHTAAAPPWAGAPGRPPGIAADLGLLLAGARPGREQQDDIVVVELLSADAPNTHLAHLIAETAVRDGLGTWVTT